MEDFFPKFCSIRLQSIFYLYAEIQQEDFLTLEKRATSAEEYWAEVFGNNLSRSSQSPLFLEKYANMHVKKFFFTNHREFYQNMCRWFKKKKKFLIVKSFCSNLIKIRAFLFVLNIDVCITLPRDWERGHWLGQIRIQPFQNRLANVGSFSA